jgi:signal peptidase II
LTEESLRINLQEKDISKRNSSAFPTILGLAAVVFALDQATKLLIVQNIPLNQSWTLFPTLARVFKLTFITNTGAAFGMFPRFGNVFVIIAAVVILAIVLFYHYLPTQNFWIRVSLGLQLGGAMGNVLDRLVRGYVVDFVDIGFWPIFNLADLSIVIGVAILAYQLWDDESNADRRTPTRHLSEGSKL